MSTPVLVLVGPTAIGKTELSLKIAASFGCEIISMDSMQVYRGMDIGTAKASRAERALVRHHLIDIVDPDEQYHAAHFVRDALVAVQDIHARGMIPLITGGTGLYLSALNKGLFDTVQVQPELRDALRQRLDQEGREALFKELQGCDPETAARIHPNDSQRLLRGLELFASTGIPWSEHIRRQEATPQKLVQPQLHIGLTCERRPLLHERIRRRTEVMMQEPFAREVEALLASGYSSTLPSMQSLGYRHMNRHLQGEWSLQEACEALVIDTRRYAKRQLTWFRASKDIHWFDRARTEGVFPLIEQFLRTNRAEESGPAAQH